jgi:hypothetical protein
MINIAGLLAICSLLTNIFALILSYLTYKESKNYTIFISQPLFMYEIYVTSIHFDDMCVTHTILIVHYIS